jgi:molybdate/tungstate transport system substrate-binding protein
LIAPRRCDLCFGKQHGVDIIKPTVTGNLLAVPPALQAAIDAAQ